MTVHYQYKRKIAHLATIGLITSALTGCFVLDVLPAETRVKKVIDGQIPEPPATPILPEPGQLSTRRLMRRIAIDLTGQLPTSSDLEVLSNDPSLFSQIANRLIDSPVAAENIAALHRRIWGLRSDTMPDLDRFAKTDPALSAQLTQKNRELITQAPLQRVRHVYEFQRPFSEVFTANYAFATSELIALWNVAATGSVAPGSPWQLYANGGLAGDGRPAGGVLTEHALNATLDSRSITNKTSRAYALLERFTCAPMPNRRAHLLYELKVSEISTGVHLQTTKKDCAACHRQINSAAGALNAIASGDSFADWISHNLPEEEFSGYYNGLVVTSSAAWIDALSADRRVARCEAQKLTEALNQGRYGLLDTVTTSVGLAYYNQNNENLREIVRAIIFSKEYRSGPTPTEVSGEHDRAISGVRILRRHQWRSILISLAPSMAAHTFPESLDPGADEYTDHRDMVPTGTYWHNVDRIARTAAARIVAEELRDSSVAMERRVLTSLPDGSGSTASSSVIYSQIAKIWEHFTGETIEESGPVYADLQTLWNASRPNGSEEDFRRGWRVVLTAVLTHPKFFTY